MKPTTTVAEARTPDGARLFLQHHDGSYTIRVDGELLMSTRAWRSEAEMAELGCAPVAGREPQRVLIGGLGFGFTLRRVLELVGPTAEVEVAELLPVVVEWNRRLLRDVNGGLLDDPRVTVTVGDVFAVLREASPGRYDVALLDVDNGPVALVDRGNRRLYADDGLRVLSRALVPGGRAVFWSGAPDRGFVRRLLHAGFRTRTVGAKAYPKAVRETHTLFVADRADGPRPGADRPGAVPSIDGGPSPR